jgi:hypothetical protein
MTTCDFGFWHKSEVPTGSENVCCWVYTGYAADITKPTGMIRSGTQT